MNDQEKGRKLLFEGVIPPMITPFKGDDERTDYEAHIANLQQWQTHGLGGYVVLGSNSETIFLSQEEKLKLIEITADVVGDSKMLIAGTGMDSTLETIRLTNHAAQRGAKAALVLTPFYYKKSMDDHALIRHFVKLADQSDIPILIYNVTKYTGVNVSTEVIRILSQHENIVGMKDSSGSIAQLVQYETVADPSFQVLVGTASIWLPALQLGVQAGIMALANCAPAACVKLQALYRSGRLEEAQRLYRKLVPVNYAVTTGYGVAGLKYVCSKLGFRGGSVRSPLRHLDAEAAERIDELLLEANLLDAVS